MAQAANSWTHWAMLPSLKVGYPDIVPVEQQEAQSTTNKVVLPKPCAFPNASRSNYEFIGNRIKVHVKHYKDNNQQNLNYGKIFTRDNSLRNN